MRFYWTAHIFITFAKSPYSRFCINTTGLCEEGRVFRGNCFFILLNLYSDFCWRHSHVARGTVLSGHSHRPPNVCLVSVGGH